MESIADCLQAIRSGRLNLLSYFLQDPGNAGQYGLISRSKDSAGLDQAEVFSQAQLLNSDPWPKDSWWGFDRDFDALVSHLQSLSAINIKPESLGKWSSFLGYGDFVFLEENFVGIHDLHMASRPRQVKKVLEHWAEKVGLSEEAQNIGEQDLVALARHLTAEGLAITVAPKFSLLRTYEENGSVVSLEADHLFKSPEFQYQTHRVGSPDTESRRAYLLSTFKKEKLGFPMGLCLSSGGFRATTKRASTRGSMLQILEENATGEMPWTLAVVPLQGRTLAQLD